MSYRNFVGKVGKLRLSQHINLIRGRGLGNGKLSLKQKAPSGGLGENLALH